MKVKLTRKMLCAMLSLVMVLTSLPLTVFAYDKEKADALQTAITDYEAKMDGTVYKNMTAAYEQYVAAIKLHDRYYYGGDTEVTDDMIDQAASELKKATEALEPWTSGVSSEVVPTQDIEDGGTHTLNSPGSSTNNVAYYNNILYVPDYAINGTAAGSANGVSVFYPESVVYYDGDKENVPTIPVMATSSNNLYGLYPNMSTSWRRDSEDVELVDEWRGVSDSSNTNFNWNIWAYWNDGTRTRVNAGYNYNTGVRGMGSYTTQNKYSPAGVYLDNGIKIKRTFGDNEYTSTIDLSWYYNINNSSDGNFASSAKIYVINYSALVNAINRNSQKLNIGVEDTFANNGLADVVSAFDKATSIDITSYAYGNGVSAAVESVNTAIGGAVEDLDKCDRDADSSVYQSLRDAIDAQRTRFEMYNSKDSTVETQKPEDVFKNWKDFKALYENAQNTMKDAAKNTDDDYPSSGDIFTKAQNYATQLNTFILTPQEEKVDTILLEWVIDNADFVTNDDNKDFFDVDENKISQIKEKVNEAKEAIWQKVENYPLDEFEPISTPENEDRVFELALGIADTIRNISVNFSKTTIYAVYKDEPMSLDSAMAKAQDILDDHREQCANSGELQIAYDNAVNYKSPDNTQHLLTEPSRAYYARDLYNNYREMVYALVDAINNLQPTFTSDIENGTVVSRGKLNESNISGSQRNGLTQTLNFKRNSGQVFFRTATDASIFGLGSASLTFTNSGISSENYRSNNFLDSINLNETSGWANFDKNNRPSAANNKGNLTATASNNSEFKITHIYITGGQGNGKTIYGRTLNMGAGGKQNSYDIVNLPFDSAADLEQTSLANKEATGVVFAYNGSTYMNVTYQLSIPAVTAYDKDSLTLTTLPTKTEYKTEGKYLNATFWLRHYNGIIHDESSSGSTGYTQTATVIDITPLTKLVDVAEEDLAKYVDGKPILYTTSSANALAEALAEANSEFEYWNMPVDNNSEENPGIIQVLQQRYTKLWNAWKGLQVRADFDNGYKDVNGATISSYLDAKYQLFTLLENPTTHFSEDSIKALNKMLATFKYLEYTEQDMADVPETEQGTINQEIAAYLKLVEDHTKYMEDPKTGDPNTVLKEVDFSAYQAVVDAVPSLNTDAYDKAEIDKLVRETSIAESFDLHGEHPIMVYKQETVDKAAKDIETQETDKRWDYTVSVTDINGDNWYMNTSDELVKGEVASAGDAKIYHYGDSVTVKNPAGSEICDWSGTITAKSTNRPQNVKYMATAAEYSFNVRGTTHLYAGESKADSGSIKITFTNNTATNQPLAFTYAKNSEAFKLENAGVPTRMFYNITKYTIIRNGEISTDPTDSFEPNGQIPADKLTEDLMIYVTYESSGEKNGYDIRMEKWNDETFTQQNAGYNRLVTVSATDIPADNMLYGLIDKKTGKIVSYSASYSFYACDDLTVKPIVRTTQDTYVDTDGDSNFDVSVISKPVLSNQRAQFVGSFAQANDSLKIIGAGVVLDASSSPATDKLTLGNVDGANNILNLSVPVSSIMKNTNQFAVSIGYAGFSNKNISYVSYVTYETVVEGKQTIHTVYSNVIPGTLN